MKLYPRSLAAFLRSLVRYAPPADLQPPADPELAAITTCAVHARLADQIAAHMAARHLTDQALDYWLSEFEDDTA